MSFPTQIISALKTVLPSLANGPFALHKLLGSAPEIIEIPVASGAGDTTVKVERALRIVDVWTVKTTATGVGSAKTVTLKNGTTTVSSAISLASVVGTLTRTASLAPAATRLAAGDTLRVTVAATAEDSSCIVYVLARHIA